MELTLKQKLERGVKKIKESAYDTYQVGKGVGKRMLNPDTPVVLPKDTQDRLDRQLGKLEGKVKK